MTSSASTPLRLLLLVACYVASVSCVVPRLQPGQRRAVASGGRAKNVKLSRTSSTGNNGTHNGDRIPIFPPATTTTTTTTTTEPPSGVAIKEAASPPSDKVMARGRALSPSLRRKRLVSQSDSRRQDASVQASASEHRFLKKKKKAKDDDDDEDVCEFGPLVYKRGEALLDERFENRCGPVEDFPCYCAPDLKPQMVCPYCVFITQDGERLCTTMHETRTIQFMSPQKKISQCTCTAKDEEDVDDVFSEPVSTCEVIEDEEGAENDQGDEDKANDEDEVDDEDQADDEAEADNEAEDEGQGDEGQNQGDEGQNQGDVGQDDEGQNKGDEGQDDGGHEGGEEGVNDNEVSEGEGDRNENEGRTGSCAFENLDGSISIYATGQSLGSLFGTKCGTVVEDFNGDIASLLAIPSTPSTGPFETHPYPCQCNPEFESQIECPYCVAQDLDGTILCFATEDTSSIQVSSNIEGENVECSCEPGTVSQCQKVPNDPPPDEEDQDPPLDEEGQNGGQGDVEQDDMEHDDMDRSVGNGDTQNEFSLSMEPDMRPDDALLLRVSSENLVEITEDGTACRVSLGDGSASALVRAGESFGRLLQLEDDELAPCGSLVDFPFVCNPNLLPNGIDYPYCLPQALAEGVRVEACIPANDGRILSFVNPDLQLCVCSYDNVPEGPYYECEASGRDPTSLEGSPQQGTSGVVDIATSGVTLAVLCFTFFHGMFR